jgi:predicted nucleotide-binding protein
MKKEVHFCATKFPPDVLASARQAIESRASILQKAIYKSNYLQVQISPRESWRHDSDAEFFADYTKEGAYGIYKYEYGFGFAVEVRLLESSCTLTAIEAPDRVTVEEIFQIFAQAAPSAKQPEQVKKEHPIVFIGHGRETQWRELKDHLQDKHHFRVEAYEVGARAGHTIRDVLEDMLAKSSIALLVLTGEDQGVNGVFRARENVIHELGLFQGKLGFPRAIAIVEEGTSEFSNLHGIQQIRFSKGRIRESFGDVLATIDREFNLYGGIETQHL